MSPVNSEVRNVFRQFRLKAAPLPSMRPDPYKGCYIGLDVLHGIVDRETGGD